MQSRGLLLVLAALPLAVAACGGKSAPTTSSTTAVVAPSSLTIVVKSVAVTSVAHDLPPKGASKGDLITFTDSLLNTKPQFGKAAAEKIGTDSGKMSFTSGTSARLTGTASLPNGTIQFDGEVTVNADGTISVAVVGGTGKYAHVTGYLRVGKGEKKALNTYTLDFPGSLPAGPAA